MRTNLRGETQNPPESQETSEIGSREISASGKKKMFSLAASQSEREANETTTEPSSLCVAGGSWSGELASGFRVLAGACR